MSAPAAARAAAAAVPRHPAWASASAAAHGIVEHEGHAVGREDRERQSRAIRHDHIRPPDQSGLLGGEDVGAVHLSQKRRRPRVDLELRQQSERGRIEGRSRDRGARSRPGNVAW